MSWNKRITDLANQPENNGQLPSIIFPCAVEYIDQDNCSICWECANGDPEHSPWKIVDYALLYAEGELDTPLICESCGKTIDPALRNDRE